MGGGSTTTENPYDDAWIKKNFKTGTKQYKELKGLISDINKFDKKQQKTIDTQKDKTQKQAQKIKGLQDDKLDASKFKNYKKQQKNLYGGLEDQIQALQTQETGIGDVTGLQSYLDDMVAGYDDTSSQLSGELDALKALQTSMSDEFKDAFESQGMSIADIQESLIDSGGDIKTLKGQFSGLEEDLGDLETSLKEDYGDKILNLSDTFSKNLSELGTDLTGSLTSLFQEGDIALQEGLDLTSEQLAALQEDLSGYKEDAATNLSNVQTALETKLGDQYGELTSGLADLQSATDQQILDVYKTGAEAVSDLDEKFAGELQAQSTSLQDQIAESEAATEEKLGQIGSLMNYRMIGDSAAGIKMRRSKAYKSGAINTGTGQLSRSMKLQTLNL